jgi:hypothetical protein
MDLSQDRLLEGSDDIMNKTITTNMHFNNKIIYDDNEEQQNVCV